MENYKEKALKLRNDVIDMLHAAKTGHPGGSLSAVEVMTALFYRENIIDKDNVNAEMRDRLVLSKGHAAPILYAVLADKGIIPQEELKTFRQIDSRLQGHPCRHKLPGVDLSTGPLGLGLGAGIGMALAKKLKGDDSYVYVLLGDGEINEGAVWEAAMAGNKFKPTNLITFIDNNGVQLDGTNDEIMPLLDIARKWESFGWNTITCDGHDFDEIFAAIDAAKAEKEKPTVIILKTVKGKGVGFMEGLSAWHGKAIDDEAYAKAKAELKGAL